VIGDECSTSANVVIDKDVTLGDRVKIHSGAVIGADGFGYAFDGEKSIKIFQLGSVRIGDDVEIGAQTTIDRGALDDTVICDGVKIDNQVQIGHNCHIGEHTIICGCVGLAGSVTLGAYCVMGGGSGAVGHITLADRVQVSAMSLVSQSISEAGRYSAGTVQMKTRDWKRATMRFKELDSLAKRLKRLERD
jgi:UDP-3-O-[3-hydroxymyristoyl] glucosamine N-acyltransferase